MIESELGMSLKIIFYSNKTVVLIVNVIQFKFFQIEIPSLQRITIGLYWVQ